MAFHKSRHLDLERKEGETEEGAEECTEREREREGLRERNRGRTRVKEGRRPRVIYQRRRRCLINEAAKFGSFLFFCPPSSDHSVIHTLSTGRMEEEERVPRPMQGIPPIPCPSSRRISNKTMPICIPTYHAALFGGRIVVSFNYPGTNPGLEDFQTVGDSTAGN